MPPSWSSNSDNENYALNVGYLKKHLRTSTYDMNTDLVCFSHVPKTGGSSLENILFKNFQAKDVLHVNAPDLVQQPDIMALKKKPAKLICGHHPMHGLLYQLLPKQPIFHLTMLRNPVDRVLSYYNYVMGKPDHPMHPQAIHRSFSEFVEALPSPEVANGQCKRFSGFLHHGQADEDTLFKEAQATLQTTFSMVLTTEQFDQGLLLLKTALGLTDIHYQRSNVSTPFRHRDDLSATEIKSVNNHNRADLRLFEWAQEQLTQRWSDAHTDADLQQFRERNERWSQLMNP